MLFMSLLLGSQVVHSMKGEGIDIKWHKNDLLYTKNFLD